MRDKERQDLRARTKRFALEIIRLFVEFPKDPVAQTLGRQMLKAGTSVGAHYWEGYYAKSDADFVNKIEGALQEVSETAYWLDLLTEAEIVKPERVKPLCIEAVELRAIFVAMVLNVKRRREAN